eukprot:366204-Chlamydomonas_euryale.AAC.5
MDVSGENLSPVMPMLNSDKQRRVGAWTALQRERVGCLEGMWECGRLCRGSGLAAWREGRGRHRLLWLPCHASMGVGVGRRALGAMDADMEVWAGNLDGSAGGTDLLEGRICWRDGSAGGTARQRS